MTGRRATLGALLAASLLAVALAVPAALAVSLWPALASPPRLVALALASGTAIELLQWILPLGRVVSPLDALLNAAGAVVAGCLVASAVRMQPSAG